MHEKPISPRLGAARLTSHLWPARAFSGAVAEHDRKKKHLQVAKRQLEQMDPDNKATQQMPVLIKDAEGRG